ncbi:MAG TPA: hypothetical protein VFE65_23195 [Pseudonocardia sp.]|jgi:hypothetical protein|nr:hypothetical protein [Pseudonocardia sp.]
MAPHREVLFDLGLESGMHQVGELLRHVRIADESGLDFFSIGDHPYFADRVDATPRWGTSSARPATSAVG